MTSAPSTHPEHLAGEITARSRSNLALALRILPRDRRRDMEIFYAFCRTVDDIADDAAAPAESRASALSVWRGAVGGAVEGEHPLAAGLRAMATRRGIDRRLFAELIDGVGMDVRGTRYATPEALMGYTYRVAGVVGLASIEIFGYRNPRCREYAVALGHALQWTNILRDVGRDWREFGRVYLPADLMARHGVDDAALDAPEESPGLRALCGEMAARADAFYREARRLLPREDIRSMVAAEIMRGVYGRLLGRMRRDAFRVLSRRYRVGRWAKAWIVARTYLASRAA